ncbi:MAG: hypothetical protein ABEI27_09280 [Halobellus sp.]|uniref:hypothetical protein n=1 Tax=Halobellus sp. TaxID=1979212 RepID=UPI0035D447CC
MRRRDLLAALPALFAGSLSGCLASAGSETSRNETTADQLPPTGYGSLSQFDAGDPFATKQVGESASDRHHQIAVWNDDADQRSIRLTLRDVNQNEVFVDVEQTFPAYGSLLIEIYRRADYVFEVMPSASEGRTLGVRRDFVDCNDSATHVAVRPDGSVRARVVSTALACSIETTSGATESETSTGAAAENTSTATPR